MWRIGGHTSVFTADEYKDCVEKNGKISSKFAGHFWTDEHSKIKTWDNNSGHFAPVWKESNVKAWDNFWGWPPGCNFEAQCAHVQPYEESSATLRGIANLLRREEEVLDDFDNRQQEQIQRMREAYGRYH